MRCDFMGPTGMPFMVKTEDPMGLWRAAGMFPGYLGFLQINKNGRVVCIKLRIMFPFSFFFFQYISSLGCNSQAYCISKSTNILHSARQSTLALLILSRVSLALTNAYPRLYSSDTKWSLHKHIK